MLRESIENLQSALKEIVDIDSALDEALIVAITDQRGIITFANRKFCEISKYSREELIGQDHRIINSGYHSKEFFRNMWRTIANGKMWRGEIRNRAKDGTIYWMDTTIVPCLNERGKPYQYVSFRIEITERKKAEEYLRRADRMEAAAQLASTIAHEVRNPLAAIKWSLLSLESSLEDRRDDIRLLLSEVDRIDSIISEFLRLAKPHSVPFKVKDVRQLLQDTLSLIRLAAKQQNVRLRTEFAEGVPLVVCEENQLKQVFMNVLNNAIEAMPNGGEILVQVDANDQGGVTIRVTDEGVGIPTELLKKLGEPFYTTKEKGTGLGLMVCQQIINQHGGTVTFDSAVGQGTTVEITLPGSDAAALGSAQSNPPGQ
ncbi:hypothetical protein GCM10025857_25600 [Alicyclobacillus contaminans]|uniref:ATP-binding protein n=1 Tax=Alicyclobacillus contaminans TaxID=392016 RepID=UPI000411C110|nr:ATP-binding protein [Alicyclobacillus contaminans]GMA51203.1 hypothetical protein GCM10025857_25600 [Alicyclobacillus contaminans]